MTLLIAGARAGAGARARAGREVTNNTSEITELTRQLNQNESAWQKLADTANKSSQSFVAAVAKNIESINEMQIVAQTLGMSTQDLSELQFVASSLNISTGELTSLLTGVTSKIGLLSQSGDGLDKKLASAFKGLNLDIKALSTADPIEQIKMLGSAINELDDHSQKVFKSEFFGGKFARLLPVLENNNAQFKALISQSRMLGLSTSDTGAKRVADASTSISESKAAVKGFYTQFSIASAPYVESFFDSITGIINDVTVRIFSDIPLNHAALLAEDYQKEQKTVPGLKETISGEEQYLKGLRHSIAQGHESLERLREMTSSDQFTDEFKEGLKTQSIQLEQSIADKTALLIDKEIKLKELTEELISLGGGDNAGLNENLELERKKEYINSFIDAASEGVVSTEDYNSALIAAKDAFGNTEEDAAKYHQTLEAINRAVDQGQKKDLAAWFTGLEAQLFPANQALSEYHAQLAKLDELAKQADESGDDDKKERVNKAKKKLKSDFEESNKSDFERIKENLESEIELIELRNQGKEREIELRELGASATGDEAKEISRLLDERDRQQKIADDKANGQQILSDAKALAYDINTSDFDKKIKGMKDQADLLNEALKLDPNNLDIKDAAKKLDKDIRGVKVNHIADNMKLGLSSMRQMTEEGSSGFHALSVAIDAINVVQAINTVLTQGSGDPYTAFARMAAAAAAVAQLGYSVNASFSGKDASAEAQAKQGTGTILGDSSAKSESIANAIELTAEATSELVGINRSMLNALQNLQRGIGGAALQIVRRGASITPSVASDALSLSNMPTISILATMFGKGIGGFVAKLAGASIKGRDSGIRVVGDSLDNLKESATIQSYMKWRERKNWIDDYDDEEITEDAGESINKQFSLVFESLHDAVLEASKTLGMLPGSIQDRLNQFVLETTDISLRGLSGEEQREAIEHEFSKIFDDIAGSVVPFAKEFQEIGEGLGETLVRLSTSVLLTEDAISKVGFSLPDFTDAEVNRSFTEEGTKIGYTEGYWKTVESGELWIAPRAIEEKFSRTWEEYAGTIGELHQSENEDDRALAAEEEARLKSEFSTDLMEFSGGFEDFNEHVAGFVEEFRTEDEKFKLLSDGIKSEFDQINLSVPETRQQFIDLFATTTDPEILAGLLKVNEAVDEYFDAIEEKNEAFQEIADAVDHVLHPSDQLAEAMENLGLSGESVLESLSGIDEMNTEQLIEAAENLGLTSEQASEYVDVLIDTGNRLKEASSDIAESVNKFFNPIDKVQKALSGLGLAGKSVLDVLEDIQDMSEEQIADYMELNGIDPDVGMEYVNNLIESGDRLKSASASVFESIQQSFSPVDKVQAALSGLGFTSKSILGALEDIRGMSEEQIADYMELNGIDPDVGMEYVNNLIESGDRLKSASASVFERIQQSLNPVDSLEEAFNGLGFTSTSLLGAVDAITDMTKEQIAAYMELAEIDPDDAVKYVDTIISANEELINSYKNLVDQIDVAVNGDGSDLMANYIKHQLNLSDQSDSAILNWLDQFDYGDLRYGARELGIEYSDAETWINGLINSVAGAQENATNNLQSYFSSVSDWLGRESDAVREAFENQIAAAEEFSNVAKELREYAEKIRLSELSPAGPGERLEQAQESFADLLDKARNDDLEALQKLTASADTYLQESDSYYGRSDDYVSIFDHVATSLEQLGINLDEANRPEDLRTQMENALEGLEKQAASAIVEAAEQNAELDNLSALLADLPGDLGDAVIESMGGSSIADLIDRVLTLIDAGEGTPDTPPVYTPPADNNSGNTGGSVPDASSGRYTATQIQNMILDQWDALGGGNYYDFSVLQDYAGRVYRDQSLVGDIHSEVAAYRRGVIENQVMSIWQSLGGGNYNQDHYNDYVGRLFRGEADWYQIQADLEQYYHGSHARGLGRVPFDGYRAQLHKDEMVLPADASDHIRRSMEPSANRSYDEMLGELKQLRAEVVTLRGEQQQANQTAQRQRDDQQRATESVARASRKAVEVV